MHRTVFTLRPVGALAIMIIMTLAIVIYAYFATQPEGSADTISDALPQVTQIKPPVERNLNAYIEWTAPAIDKSVPLKNRYTGYVVKYYDVFDPAKIFYKLVTARAIQIQSLVKGKNYKGTISVIDSLGNEGPPSKTFEFKSDDTEVIALQKQKDAGELIFYDGFDNLPEGPPDSTKWGVAMGICSNPNGLTVVGINGQNHIHNVIATGSCDHEDSSARMRERMSLSDGGIRTLSINQDITTNGPATIWIRMHESKFKDLDRSLRMLFSGSRKGPNELPQEFPGTFAVSFSNEKVTAEKTDSVGDTRILASANLDKLGFVLDSNLQHKVEYKYGLDNFTLNIDGRKVIDYSEKNILKKDVDYSPMVTLAGYNVNKLRAGTENNWTGVTILDLFHWDRVSLSAAPNQKPSDIVHNYQAHANSEMGSQSPGKEYTIDIPDAVIGTDGKPGNQKFLGQMTGSDAWAPNDTITINRKKFTLPNPKDTLGLSNTPPTAIRDSRSFPFALDIGTAVKTGINTFVFNSETRTMRLIGTHVEVSYPRGTQPAYTPYTNEQPASKNTLPVNTFGPDALLKTFGGINVISKELRLKFFDKNEAPLIPSGIARLEVTMGNYNARQGAGTFPGNMGLQVVIDDKVVAAKRTDAKYPSPLSYLYFDIDINKLASGTHRMYIEPLSPGCVLGKIGNKDHLPPGYTGPFYFKVENKTTVNSLPAVTPICESKVGVGSAPAPDLETQSGTQVPTPHHGTGNMLLNPLDVVVPTDTDLTDSDGGVSVL